MYCKETYGMDHKVEDFWVYEFAKVRQACLPRNMMQELGMCLCHMQLASGNLVCHS
jgi:hypothetical protein